MVRDNFVGSVSYCREYEEGAVVLSGALASPVREPYTRSRPADYKLARHPRSCLTSHACVGKLWMVRIPGVRDAWEGGDYVGVKVKHVLTRDDPPFSVQADGRLFTRYPRVSEGIRSEGEAHAWHQHYVRGPRSERVHIVPEGEKAKIKVKHNEYSDTNVSNSLKGYARQNG